MEQKKKDITKLIKRWYVLLGFSIILTLLIYVFCTTSFMQETELKLLDHRFRLDPEPAKADTNIVLIIIDDHSLDFFSKNGISWPWPRSYYGFVVDYFNQASSIIFDMQFYENDINREETYAWQTDAAFAEAIRENGNVFLGTQLLLDSTFVNPKVSNSVLELSSNLNFQHIYSGIRAPVDTLLTPAKALGVINVAPDNDGVIRRIPLLSKLENSILPQMSLQVVINQLANNSEITIYRNKLQVENYRIPFDKNRDYLINWYGHKMEVQPFKTYPFRAIIASASAVISGAEAIIPPSNFAEKHIIIGATASGLMDLKTSPYSQIMPGLEIWATTLSNFLNNDHIIITETWINLLITFLLIYFLFYFFINFSIKNANLFSFLLLILIIISNFTFWKYGRILLNLIMPISAFIFSYLLVNIISYLLERKSRRQIRKMFSRYINEEVIKELEKNPDQVKMGGEEITATVLYTDIYDFTTLSESKLPTELVKDLNRYFEILVRFIFKYFGLLDKYTGDGIMAVFGAPLPRKDHALLACYVAIAHKQYREELLNKDKITSAEELHLKTRIGINSGRLIAGNIGSDKRMDYTAIGNTVNLAARLEGVNKLYQTNSIISEHTYKFVKEEFLCRELDSLQVKGKNESTKIYEIIAKRKKSENSKMPGWITEYENALMLYRMGKFNDAMKIFEDLANSDRKDKASKVMQTRCKYLKKTKPENWDGILKLEVK